MKNKTIFSCTVCGSSYDKWMGKCPGCGSWNSIEEEMRILPTDRMAKTSLEIEPVLLRDIGADSDVRMSTGIAEFDLVLGGGLVKGSLVLVGGDPGIGKSTLLLQAAANMGRVLYASGEESLRQVKLRAERIAGTSDQLFLVCENRLEQVLAAAEKVGAQVVIIDSIQTMVTNASGSAQGSVSQVREATAQLMTYAKTRGVSIFIVGHVTKSGSIAGPKILEHMVDTVLYFEGDFRKMYRVLRAVKNRFGSVSEIGVFEMTGSGLIDVPNPSALFLGEGGHAVILPVIEGSRAMLLEIQCLVSQSFLANPRRMGAGVDHGKLMLLLAVLEKRLGMSFYQHDVYLNVVGGFEVDEPAADLAIASALICGIRGMTLSQSLAILGEVGLTGEIRAVSHAQQRINEAAKMGLRKVILPESSFKKGSLDIPKGVAAVGIRHIKELLPHLE